jgi:DDE superfamily endonuclease
MFTETSLHDYPQVVKAFMGLPAEHFPEVVQQVAERLSTYEQQRLARPDRQRAVGGGNTYDQPLSIRIALGLTYLRLHIPQAAVAALYGATQSDVSRELRRLLPLIRAVLPSPPGWRVVAEGAELPDVEQVAAEDLADGRVLVDATEQRVARARDNDVRKAHYSGKKKAFTLKTQFVTDGNHHIAAISEAVPGAKHDKKLSDALRTTDRLPDGCEVDADKGYQGLDQQVDRVTIHDAAPGADQQIPRLTVKTPIKKAKGQELTEEQKAFNRQLNAVRVRVEHWIGWVKNWAIIATRFRCAHTIYTPIMQVVCGLVNAQTERWQAAEAANCA